MLGKMRGKRDNNQTHVRAHTPADRPRVLCPGVSTTSYRSNLIIRLAIRIGIIMVIAIKIVIVKVIVICSSSNNNGNSNINHTNKSNRAPLV